MDFTNLEPRGLAADKSHHVGNPATSFRNPWPSFPTTHASFTTVLKARFFDTRPPFVPVPADRSGLVPIQRVDFNVPAEHRGFRVTWIGHASFLVQYCSPDLSRPLGILFDPVFAERTSPVTFLGPKRYTPVPCSLSELLNAVTIDVVCVSHNHYDHADVTALQSIYEHGRSGAQNVIFCVALGNSRWLRPLGIPAEQIWEADWWTRISVSLPLDLSKKTSLDLSGIGTGTTDSNHKSVTITCTPSQHASARSFTDRNQDLWCSWVVEEQSEPNRASSVSQAPVEHNSTAPARKSLFFAGDTGYRTVPQSTDASADLDDLPVCSAFKQIGECLGPFDIALLPIGLCRPRHFMSSVHCNSTDSMDIHADIKSKRSVGMHWGTVRGGISAYWEDVKDPPREWQEEATRRGLKWREHRGDSDKQDDWQVGLMDVGESLLI